jgi:hypothetical protein
MNQTPPPESSRPIGRFTTNGPPPPPVYPQATAAVDALGRMQDAVGMLDTAIRCIAGTPNAALRHGTLPHQPADIAEFMHLADEALRLSCHAQEQVALLQMRVKLEAAAYRAGAWPVTTQATADVLANWQAAHGRYLFAEHAALDAMRERARGAEMARIVDIMAGHIAQVTR